MMKTENLLTILYEDSDLIVVHKPAGVESQPGKSFAPDMVSILKKYFVSSGQMKVPYVGVVHRLDKPVEGLLVYAKTPKANAALSKMTAEHRMEKHYCAVVRGNPGAGGKLVNYLITDRTGAGEQNLRNALVFPEDRKGTPELEELERRCGDKAKRAELEFWNVSSEEDRCYRPFLQRLKELGYESGKEGCMVNPATGERASLLRIRLKTGRYHQIRAQLSHAGYPILGDRRYNSEDAEESGFATPALCSAELAFVHPVTGKKMSFSILKS